MPDPSRTSAPDGALAAATGPAAATGAVPRDVWWVTAVVILGAFMTQLDAALVNVGLASVAGALDTSLQTAQWVVSVYLLALVIALPLCSWASRRVGASTLWLWSLGGFTVASAFCAAAPTIEVLILARALQGFAGGLLLPAGQTVIAQVAGKKLMGRVMSTAGMALVLGPALGPTVGGLLIAHASWPWLFLVNLPVGVAGLWLGRRLMPRNGARETTRFDTPGFVLLGAALPAITFAVSRAGRSGGDRIAGFWAPLLVGLVLLAAFGWTRSRMPAPLLRVNLLRNRVFTAGALASFVAGAIQFGALVIWALYFQLARGYDVVDTGVAMVGFAVGAATLPVAGRLTDRFGGGPVALAGALVTTATFVPMALLPQDADLIVVEALLLVLGLGNALSVIPASTAAYVSVAPGSIPDAVTLVNIFLRLGGAVGAALLVTVLGGSSPSTGATHFAAAFWCLTALAAVSIVSAAYLAATSRPGPARP